MTEVNTNLKTLRKFYACQERYARLVEKLGPGWGDTGPIPLLLILRHNGLHDAMWALRAIDKKARKWISPRIAIECAAHVLPIFEKAMPGDKRVSECLHMTRLFLMCKAKKKQLLAATDAAASATTDAAAYAAAYVSHAANAAAYAAYAAAYVSHAANAAAYAAYAAYTANAAYAAYAADAAAFASHAANAAAEKEWQAAVLRRIIREYKNL